LFNFRALALFNGVKPAGLVAQILQDGAGFKDRDRLAVRSIRIDNGRHASVWRDGQKIGGELFLF